MCVFSIVRVVLRRLIKTGHHPQLGFWHPAMGDHDPGRHTLPCCAFCGEAFPAAAGGTQDGEAFKLLP